MQDPIELRNNIKKWSKELGFDDVGISGIDIKDDEKHLKNWLEKKFHGSMNYMMKHGNKRSRAELLVPGTIRVISLKIHYYSRDKMSAKELIDNDSIGYIANYALGKDYHKTIKKKLKVLSSKIKQYSDLKGQSSFVDSAPVLERAFARNAGLGWIGKHTNLIDKSSGSWFFLAEIYTDLELPIDKPSTNHCGTCRECIDVCPTQAIIAPYQLDARKCISYLTIENKESIPLHMRKPIGNRIFGCDDCQSFCPWNKFAKSAVNTDFKPNSNLLDQPLEKLFLWSEKEWDKNTRGTALRRSGYNGWLRNIAVALGNSKTTPSIKTVLKSRLNVDSEMLREHIIWALEQH